MSHIPPIVRRQDVACTHLPAELPLRLRQILANRGVTSSEQLQLSNSQLLTSKQLRGIEQAVTLLNQALKAQQRILIVGDFDCDGATSTALCVLALRAMGGEQVDFLVPNRFEYGYGLTPEIVALAERHFNGLSAELLITVDNGISSFSGVAAAKAAGMTVIVTDHHLPAETMPDADAIVNPNQPDCPFPSKSLAGVGVAFYLLAALASTRRQEGLSAPNMASYLDLVALGTVADVVPLDFNNRILVHQGLQRIRAGACRPAITALIEVSKRQAKDLTATDLGFALGPRLNAVGRLDDMSLGVASLLCDSLDRARVYASEMDSLNRERKEIEEGMQQEALAAVAQIRIESEHPPAGMVLYRPDWHQGVIGLVASRIKERYFRPVIALAESSDDEVKGSGRSIPGVHLRDLLELIDTRYPGLILKFGGHAMAAGLTLRKEHISAFTQAFEKLAAEMSTPEILTETIVSDGALSDEELSIELAELLRTHGPWGQAFPEPLFDGRFRLLQQRLVGEKHLKVTLATPTGRQIDGIAFSVDLRAWPNPNAQWIEAVYRLEVNEWNGRRSPQLLIQSLRTIEPNS